MPPWATLLPYLQAIFGGLGIFDQQNLDKEASEANEARYNQILGELGGPGQRTGLYGRTMPAITRLVNEAKKSGERERADLGSMYAAQESQATSDLTRSGLGGSTVGTSMKLGFARERQQAMDRLNEQLKGYNFSIGQLPLQYDTQLTQNRTGVIERRNDVAGTSPWAAFSQLAQSLIPAPRVDQPRDNSILGAGIGALGSAGGLLGAAGILK